MSDPNGGRSAILKWYPEAWRDRYGDELIALLDDRYGSQPVPLAARISMMRAGTSERLRDAGVVGRSVGPEGRVRGASLVVLCGWALFVIAGAGFAKYAEHWDLVTPQHDRALPSAALVAVQAAAAVGVVIFAIAAVIALPAFVRYVRERRWVSVRGPLIATLVTSSIAVIATVCVIAWSHHSDSPPLNNGFWPYRTAGIAWALVVVVAIGVGTGAIATVVTKLELSPRASKTLGILALSMTTAVTVIFLGMLTWWISLALHAPWFFRSGIYGTAGSVAPLAMMVFGALMVVGLILGAYGATRVVRSLGEISRSELA